MFRLFEEIVIENSGREAPWILESLDRLRGDARERDLHIFLGMAPRRLGKSDLRVSRTQFAAIDEAFPGWRIGHWSIDGAARVLGLINFRTSRPFADLFKDLRRTADAAELIALYRGLPLYPEPESLDFEIGEALRSNVRPVFEAVLQNNPFPRTHFDEHRWNHMILKALFVGSDLGSVIGLQDRANRELARMLLDYAEERWAAHRPVPADLWLAIKPMQDAPAVADRITAAISDGRLDREVLA